MKYGITIVNHSPSTAYIEIEADSFEDAKRFCEEKVNFPYLERHAHFELDDDYDYDFETITDENGDYMDYEHIK